MNDDVALKKTKSVKPKLRSSLFLLIFLFINHLYFLLFFDIFHSRHSNNWFILSFAFSKARKGTLCGLLNTNIVP